MSTEALKEEILQKVKEYYQLNYGPKKEFVENDTYINYAGRLFDEDEMVNLVDSSLEFWLTHGRYSKEFEEKLARYLGVKYCLLVNSGSSANLLAFMALTSPLLEDRQINRGDEVITVAAGFPTTTAPIVQYGAVPVFVDVSVETGNIDCTSLSKALSGKTKAVMLAHTLGNPFNVRKVKQFCDEHKLWLIEDNCDALGAEFAGQLTGTWGDIGTSSFYPPHHMTMGEGGAVYTNDSLLKKIMLSIRDWGRDCWCQSGQDNCCGQRFNQQFGTLPFGYDHKYVYSHFGYNLKATDMQAAIGVAQLEKLPGFVEARRNNYDFFYEQLKKYEDILILPRVEQDAIPSWFGFLITIKEHSSFSRNDFAKHLETHKIQTRNLFCGNMVRQPIFANLQQGIDYRVVGTLKNTDLITEQSFWIGVYPGLSDEQKRYVVKVIDDYMDRC